MVQFQDDFATTKRIHNGTQNDLKIWRLIVCFFATYLEFSSISAPDSPTTVPDSAITAHVSMPRYAAQIGRLPCVLVSAAYCLVVHRVHMVRHWAQMRVHTVIHTDGGTHFAPC